MPLCLTLALVWSLAAGGALALPPRHQWPMVWVLTGTGIPLLGVLTFQAGPVVGLAGLVVAALLLSRALAGLGQAGDPRRGEV